MREEIDAFIADKSHSHRIVWPGRFSCSGPALESSVFWSFTRYSDCVVSQRSTNRLKENL